MRKCEWQYYGLTMLLLCLWGNANDNTMVWRCFHFVYEEMRMTILWFDDASALFMRKCEWQYYGLTMLLLCLWGNANDNTMVWRCFYFVYEEMRMTILWFDDASTLFMRRETIIVTHRAGCSQWCLIGGRSTQLGLLSDNNDLQEIETAGHCDWLITFSVCDVTRTCRWW